MKVTDLHQSGSSLQGFLGEVDALLDEHESADEVEKENAFWDWYWAEYEKELQANQVNLSAEISMHSACRGPVVMGPFGVGRSDEGGA